MRKDVDGGAVNERGLLNIIFKWPLLSSATVFVGAFLILGDILILGVSLDAIISMSKNEVSVSSKISDLFGFMGVEGLLVSLTALQVYISILFLIHLSVMILHVLKNSGLRLLKFRFANQLLSECGRRESPVEIKRVRGCVKDVDHLFRVMTFFIFCVIVLIAMIFLNPYVACVLFVSGVCHLVVSLVLEKKEQSFRGNFERISKSYISLARSRGSDLDEVVGGRHSYWEKYIALTDYRLITVVVNSTFKVISISAVIFVLNNGFDELFSLYPILLVLAVGRFHQYMEGLSASFKKI